MFKMNKSPAPHRPQENTPFFEFYLILADYNLLRVARALCLLSFVTWPQCYGFKQKCAMAQCTPTAQFSISALPLAQFHYPHGIQGVMASRARNPVGHFKFFAQTCRSYCSGTVRKCSDRWARTLEPFVGQTVALSDIPPILFKLYICFDFRISKLSDLWTTPLNRFTPNWRDGGKNE